MIGPRLELHSLLKELLGSENVYFQPPSNIRMHFPCIVYKLENISNNFADNNVYLKDHSYKITYITKDPDDEMIDKLSSLPQTRFQNHYYVDGLNHYAYIKYYK